MPCAASLGPAEDSLQRMAFCDRNRRSESCCPPRKFVQIEISKIDNPKRYAVQFKLYYLPPKKKKSISGPSAPILQTSREKFIVATQGKVKDEGLLMFSMTLVDKPEPDDNVEVALKRIICRPE